MGMSPRSNFDTREACWEASILEAWMQSVVDWHNPATMKQIRQALILTLVTIVVGSHCYSCQSWGTLSHSSAMDQSFVCLWLKIAMCSSVTLSLIEEKPSGALCLGFG